jgi:hypothetical protein
VGRLGDHVIAHGTSRIAAVERAGQRQPIDLQRIQREDIVVDKRIVERRERPVVAEVAAGHLGMAGEPAGVVVEALARRLEAGHLHLRPALAARREAAAERTFGDPVATRRHVDEDPVEEVGARQVGRHLATGLVDVVTAARHVEVVADQRKRLRAGRDLAPLEVRIEVLRIGRAALVVGFAGRVALGDPVAVGPTVAQQLHDAVLLRVLSFG